MRTTILCLFLLTLASCTDPKPDTKTGKAKAEAKPGLTSTMMTPISTPMRARTHLRQEVRKINHKSQLRNQKMQKIQGQPGR